MPCFECLSLPEPRHSLPVRNQVALHPLVSTASISLLFAQSKASRGPKPKEKLGHGKVSSSLMTMTMIHDLSRRLYLKQRQKDKSSDLIFRVFDFPFSTFEPPLWHVSDENSSTHSGICFTTVNQSARPFYMVKPHLPNGSNCPHLWQHLLLSSRLCHGVVVGSSPGSVHWQLPGIHRNQQREQTPS